MTTAAARRRQLVILTTRSIDVPRHAYPDVTEATAAVLVDDPETFWRIMTTWR
jgi:hypothetical protein